MAGMYSKVPISGPKYQRIAEALRASVRSGHYPPGSRIPTEASLAEEFDVSVPTVRQAIAVLRAEGLLMSRHGVGTFVRDLHRLRRRSRDRYGIARSRPGLLSDNLRHEITFAGRAGAPADIAEIMGIAPGTEVILRRRALFSRRSGEIEEIGASWLPVEIAGGTYLEEPAVVPKALFRCVEELTGRTYGRATDRWVARLPTPGEILALKLPTGAAVLHVVHTARDERGTVVEVSESIWPADRIEIIDDYPIPGEARPGVASDI